LTRPRCGSWLSRRVMVELGAATASCCLLIAARRLATLATWVVPTVDSSPRIQRKMTLACPGHSARSWGLLHLRLHPRRIISRDRHRHPTSPSSFGPISLRFSRSFIKPGPSCRTSFLREFDAFTRCGDLRHGFMHTSCATSRATHSSTHRARTSTSSRVLDCRHPVLERHYPCLGQRFPCLGLRSPRPEQSLFCLGRRSLLVPAFEPVRAGPVHDRNVAKSHDCNIVHAMLRHAAPAACLLGITVVDMVGLPWIDRRPVSGILEKDVGLVHG